MELALLTFCSSRVVILKSWSSDGRHLVCSVDYVILSDCTSVPVIGT